jgi:hypothetical protein
MAGVFLLGRYAGLDLNISMNHNAWTERKACVGVLELY